MIQRRPQHFSIDPTNSLASGLVFAGLGNCPGNVTMQDSARGNNGTLTNMTPASDWVFVPELGRWGFKASTASSKVSLTDVDAVCSDTFSWSFHLLRSSPGYFTNVCGAPYGRAANGGYLIRLKSDRCDVWITGVGDEWIVGNPLPSGSPWRHVCLVQRPAGHAFYLDGVLFASEAITGTIVYDTSVGCGFGAYGFTADGNVYSDPLIYNRALTPTEIADLADPSNVYLSGLIAGRRRPTYFMPTSSPTAFKPAWARYCNNLIGGGVS